MIGVTKFQEHLALKILKHEWSNWQLSKGLAELSLCCNPFSHVVSPVIRDQSQHTLQRQTNAFWPRYDHPQVVTWISHCRNTVHAALARMGLRHHFATTVTAEDGMETTSQQFLSAAIKLGRPPQDCVVFESNPLGIAAAHNCSCKVSVLSSSFLWDILPQGVVKSTDHQTCEACEEGNVISCFTHRAADTVVAYLTLLKALGCFDAVWLVSRRRLTERIRLWSLCICKMSGNIS